MARQIFAQRRYFCFIGGLHSALFGDHDSNYFDKLEEEVKPVPRNGFDRIRALFGTSVHGTVTKEMASIYQLTGLTFVAGAMVGIFQKATTAQHHFIATNMHEKFISPYEAKRKLMDHVVLSSWKGGFKWGTKCAIFVFIYSFTSIVISAYRDKEGVIEHTIGGALAGSFARAYLGYKATLVGAGLGAALSTILGLFTVFANKGFNVSLNDVREFQYQLKLHRLEAIRLLTKEGVFGKEYGPLLKSKMAQNESEDGYAYKASNEDKVFVVVDSQSNENENFDKNPHTNKNENADKNSQVNKNDNSDKKNEF